MQLFARWLAVGVTSKPRLTHVRRGFLYLTDGLFALKEVQEFNAIKIFSIFVSDNTVIDD